MKNKTPKLLKPNRLKKVKKYSENKLVLELSKKKLEKAKRKRNEKKIRDKIGFEYKDRKKVW
jgi:hypothetical protein